MSRRRSIALVAALALTLAVPGSGGGTVGLHAAMIMASGSTYASRVITTSVAWSAPPSATEGQAWVNAL